VTTLIIFFFVQEILMSETYFKLIVETILARLNDNGMSFEEIADIIERNF
jgi:hypothetical protein